MTADDHEFLFCSGSAADRKLYISDHKSNTVYSMAYTGGNLTAVVNVTRPIGVSATLLQSPTSAPTQPQPSHDPTSSAPSLAPTTNYSTMYWSHREERSAPRGLLNAHPRILFWGRHAQPTLCNRVSLPRISRPRFRRTEERHELEAALAATSAPAASGTVAPTPVTHPTPRPTSSAPSAQPTVTAMPTVTPYPSTPPTPVPSPAPTKSAVPSPEPTAWCKKDYFLYYTSGVLGYDSFVEFLQDPTTVADVNQTHMAEIDNG